MTAAQVELLLRVSVYEWHGVEFEHAYSYLGMCAGHLSRLQHATLQQVKPHACVLTSVFVRWLLLKALKALGDSTPSCSE